MQGKTPDWFDENLEESVEPAFREAVEWFGILSADEVSGRDRAAFRAWLRRDVSHAEAFAQVTQMWGGLKGLPEAKRRRRTITRRNLGKAVFAIAVTGGVWGAYRSFPLADFRTGRGERRSVFLPDGTQVELSTSTAFSIHYEGVERRVTLHKGEAFFSVAPNAERPFVVAAARGRVTALGTAFSVASDEDRVIVTVAEHAVRLDLAGQTQHLETGFQAAFDASHIGAAVPVDTAEILAWREGRLVFVNTPLKEVTKALDRWRTGRTVILNNVLANHSVTLIVELDRVGDALDRLQDALPIAVTQVTPLLTLVHAR